MLICWMISQGQGWECSGSCILILLLSADGNSGWVVPNVVWPLVGASLDCDEHLIEGLHCKPIHSDFTQNDQGWPKKSGSNLGLASRCASHGFTQEHDIIKYFDKNFCTKVLWTTFCGILSGYFLSLFWVFTEQCHITREHLRTTFMMSFLR